MMELRQVLYSVPLYLLQVRGSRYLGTLARRAVWGCAASHSQRLSHRMVHLATWVDYLSHSYSCGSGCIRVSIGIYLSKYTTIAS